MSIESVYNAFESRPCKLNRITGNKRLLVSETKNLSIKFKNKIILKKHFGLKESQERYKLN